MFAVLYEFASWSESWQDARVIIFSDNESVVDGITNRTIRGAGINPLQRLFLIAARRNIDVAAVWVPTKANALAGVIDCRVKMST